MGPRVVGEVIQDFVVENLKHAFSMLGSRHAPFLEVLQAVTKEIVKQGSDIEVQPLQKQIVKPVCESVEPIEEPLMSCDERSIQATGIYLADKELRPVFGSLTGSASSLFGFFVLVLVLELMFGQCSVRGVTEALVDPSVSEEARESIRECCGGQTGAILSRFQGSTGGLDWSDVVVPLRPAGRQFPLGIIRHHGSLRPGSAVAFIRMSMSLLLWRARSPFVTASDVHYITRGGLDALAQQLCSQGSSAIVPHAFCSEHSCA